MSGHSIKHTIPTRRRILSFKPLLAELFAARFDFPLEYLDKLGFVVLRRVGDLVVREDADEVGDR